MTERVNIAAVAATVGCVSTLLLVFIWRWCNQRKRRSFVEPRSLTRITSLQESTHRLHPQHPTQQQHHNNNDQGIIKNRTNYFVFHRGISGRPLFSWSDHPYLAADAVENGWSRFAFTAYKTHMSSPSKRSNLLGSCGVGDQGKETEAEMTWEVSHGSSDYMQKIRLNPGLKRVHQNCSSMSVASVIRTSLPLPGPPLGNHSFPQEAYFEISILYSRGDDYESVGKSREGEKIKLIHEGKSEALVHVTSGHKISNVEEVKLDGKKSEYVSFSLGLTVGGSVPLRVPGSYPGSIGFNSNGSVFLDGNLSSLNFNFVVAAYCVLLTVYSQS